MIAADAKLSAAIRRWTRGMAARKALDDALAAERKATAIRIVEAAHAAYRKGGVGDAECQAIIDAVERAAKEWR